jgi:prepilin-type N-terminal cleavage/methylation domain-containing protein
MLAGNERGFTLVEILVTSAVSMILLGSIYMAVNSAQRHSMGIERKVAAQQDVRPSLELMAMEIRMASFNPWLKTGNWVLPPGVTGACTSAGNQAYLGIQEATDTSITVEMDVNSLCSNNNIPSCMTTGAGNPNAVIRYNYDMANQRMTRETNCGGAMPFLGDTAASGNPRTVLVVNDIDSDGIWEPATDVPVFRYYDGSGALIATTGNPPSVPAASVPNIRRIEITIAAQTEDVDPNTKQRRSLIYSTSVIPRNHGPQ